MRGCIPGSIGRVPELHGTYYHDHWSFGPFFEAKVAAELSEFIGRYIGERDGFWVATLNGRVEGSITIDANHVEDEGAHLRWFIMSDALRGRGIGKRLIEAAIDFCTNRGYKKVYLWTFEGLNAARHLYEKVGFQLVEQHKGRQWGKKVKEQRFDLKLE
jgi:GNAT superfamily N-acetyltransferase